MESDVQIKLRQLQQQLAVREQEVAALREIAEAASELQSQDVQAAKVIELSKKNRSLNLVLEKEKHKVAKLQQALSEATQKQQASAGASAPAANEERVREVATLKERLQQLTNKLGQMEQKVFLLESENRKLTRALVREVGEDVPLQKVLDESGSDWKGRREQIVFLKDTIKQLKEAAGTAGPPGSSYSSGVNKHENAHRSVIGKLNKQREGELQRMAAEVEAAKQAAEQLRLQYTGAASRRKVLEAEVAGMKDKLAVVLNKTHNDDKLITALRNELATAAKGKSGSAEGPQSLQLSQQHCSQLEEQIEQQQKVIRYLQAQLEINCSGISPGNGPQQVLEQLQDENEALRQELAALQLGTEGGKQKAGSGALSSVLKQQVVTLQEDNAQLRAQLDQLMPSKVGLHLTQSDLMVLEAAKEAVAGDDDDAAEASGDQQEEEEEGEGEEEDEESEEEEEESEDASSSGGGLKTKV